MIWNIIVIEFLKQIPLFSKEGEGRFVVPDNNTEL